MRISDWSSDVCSSDLLQSELDRYFGERVVAVELDPDMIAKAAAGARRIRLRTSAQYTDYDHHQLLQHEAFVHSLTALNGREQAVLGSLSLASPRSEEHTSDSSH